MNNTIEIPLATGMITGLEFLVYTIKEAAYCRRSYCSVFGLHWSFVTHFFSGEPLFEVRVVFSPLTLRFGAVTYGSYFMHCL
jgi:hypothetical protein